MKFIEYLDSLNKGDFYTGVGSRETPRDVALVMCAFAIEARDRGLRLRSGGADGADLAFESGSHPEKEIFLPFRKFNGSESSLWHIPEKCFDIAAQIHPAWDRCSDFARKAHARNAQQVMGRNLDLPSKFLVCWTAGGELLGGTRTAIVMAKKEGVPVLNLGKPKNLETLRELIKKDYLEQAKSILQTKGKENLKAFKPAELIKKMESSAELAENEWTVSATKKLPAP